jgi:hydroxyacylglutathione hydrolase
MHIERFFVPGLAHASYLLESDGKAIIVDPERHLDRYHSYLTNRQLKLIGIFLTHPHADFVAGHSELALQYDVPIYISNKAPATFPHADLHEGDKIQVGAVELIALDTPGHSPDSICLVIRQNGNDVALFSGDTLFAGDVGRPDLRDEAMEQLAEMLYDSLFGKLSKLPDEARVYPAHGAGSLCGRQIASTPFTTIGQEKTTNWAFQFKNRAEFVQAMTDNLPERPLYFDPTVRMNLKGAAPLRDGGELKRIDLAAADLLRKQGGTVLDARPAAIYGEAHLGGSFNIGLGSPSFAVWAGFVLPLDRAVILVVDFEEDAVRAQAELARIGVDKIEGFLLSDDLEETVQTTQIGANDFLDAIEGRNPPFVLDVRSLQEWRQDNLDGSVNMPLPTLTRRLEGVPRSACVAVICGSGYRSSIATSVLEGKGFTRLQNVMGGMHAVRHAKRPKVRAMELAGAAMDWVI